ncbi:hypothetical protein [uncultured Friedmanniella sp.]|uniref:hypothetical protein n=1 Tax=uncultured Friedmanniella sp. TaxID=335381 RepID=UPI0035CA8E0B
MSARSYVEQRAQYGKEATAGTAVPATSRPSTGKLEFNPKQDTERDRSSGEYVDNLVYVKRETSEGSLEGVACYNGLTDQLALAFGAPTTTVVVADKAFKHEYVLSASRPTWTVQVGDAVSAFEVAGVIAKSVEFELGNNSGDSSFKMELEGGAITDGITRTAGSTKLPARPVLGGTAKVYVDPTFEELGTTLLAGGLKETIKFGDLADLIRLVGGYTTVNTAIDGTVELLSVADTAGRSFLASLRTSTPRYVRIETTGLVLDGAVKEKLTFDFCVNGESHERGEEDAVYAATNGLRIVVDANGFSHKVTLVNSVA